MTTKKTPPTQEVHSRATFPLPNRQSGTPTTPSSASAQLPTKARVSVQRVDDSPKKRPTLAPGTQFYRQMGTHGSPDPVQDRLPPPKPDKENSPEYVSLELPSGYHFYPFKDLSAATSLKGAHQAKFNRAATENSLSIAVETVSSLLGDGVSAHDLTVPDFGWVLMWLRLNCYGKVQLQNATTCNNEGHLRDVVDKKKSPESLKTVDIIDKTRLKTTMFNPDTVAGLEFPTSDELPYILVSPTMRDSIELLEMREDPDFQELEYLADMASCIQTAEGPPLSLKDRIRIVADLDTDTTHTLMRFASLSTEYGVSEFYTTTCKGCGAEVTTKVEISAQMFSGRFNLGNVSL